MKLLLILSICLSVLKAEPEAQFSPYHYGGYAPVYSTNYVAPAVAPAPVTPVQSSQFHAQDEFGQYNYGYSNKDSAKQEFKTADGIIQGTYSYVDANGIVQTTNYIADGLGFRVAATNLPQAPVAAPVAPVAVAETPIADVPEVKTTDVIDLRTPDVPVVAPATAPVATAPVVAPAYVANSWGNPSPYVYAAQAAPVYTTNYVPVAPVSTPVAAPIPVVAAASPIKASQFHAQDEFGQYNYGYSDPNSAKQEVKDINGIVQGSYSYVDANGIVQTTNYIADGHGFRVAATNLPHAPVAAPVEPVVAVETPAAAVVPEVKSVDAFDIRTEGLTDDISVVAAAPSVVASAPVVAPVQVPVQQVVYDIPYTAPVVSAPVISVPAANPVPVHHPVPATHVATPYVVTDPGHDDLNNNQFHAQDDWGQYNYGYSTPSLAKQEIKTADGVTRGVYSYVDANSEVQTVHYVSDAAGFRVAATNLPDDGHPPVAPAPIAPAPVATPVQSYVSPYHIPYAPHYQNYVPAAIPNVEIVETPIVNQEPVEVAKTFYQSIDKDEYDFGYTADSAERSETRDVNGVVIGSYNYVDTSGNPQTVKYQADENGFQVLDGTTLLQTNVEDTPEVAAAKEAHFKLVEEEKLKHVNDVEEDVAMTIDLRQGGFDGPPREAKSIENVVPQNPDAIIQQASSLPSQTYFSQPEEPLAAQYQSQDDLGQYSYGYSNEDSYKNEQRTADGIVRGSYSYVDANGELQVVHYISDAFGFRVSATNLPEAPIAAPVQEQPIAVEEEAIREAKSADAHVPITGYASGHYYAPTYAYAPTYTYAAPAPVVPVAPVSGSQFHAQDEASDQYHFGYANGDSSKEEIKLPDGSIQGTYSYVDANGIVQTVNYVADEHGFRVAATNLPKSPAPSPAAAAAPVLTPDVYVPVAAPVAPTVAAEVPAAVVPEVKTTDAIDLRGEVFTPTDDISVVAAAPPVAAAPLAYVTHPVAHDITLFNPFDTVAKTAVENSDAEITPIVAAPVPYSAIPVPVEQPVQAAVPATYVPSPYVYAHQAAPVYTTNYVPATVPVTAPVAPATPLKASQFHAQDAFGQYNYGYSDENSAKQEFKTADGIIQGTYSYVDANGIVQTTNYIADGHGFRVAATNLPQAPVAAPIEPTVAAEVPAAVVPQVKTTDAIDLRGEDIAVVAAAETPVATAPVPAQQVVYNHHPYAAPVVSAPLNPVQIIQSSPYVYANSYANAAPIYSYAQSAAPVYTTSYVPAAPVAPVTPVQSSQFHAQDEFGQYNYGYSNPTSAKQEYKTADGIVQGTYSYVDANGIVQTTNYIADGHGFRVAATNLPQAPVAAA